MKNSFGLFFLMIFLIISSCKNSEIQTKPAAALKDTAKVKKEYNLASNGILPDTPVASSFNDPVARANNKYSHYDVILKNDLCNKFWKYDGGIDGNRNITQDEVNGDWIEFNENGKYTKSKYNKIVSTGTYTVDSQGFMELTPSKSGDKKSEFQLKFNNDLLIMIGTTKYSNSNLQMRLSRIFEKPRKQ